MLPAIKTLKINRNKAVLITILSVLCLMPQIALAAPWDDAATGVIDSFNSGFARSLAIIAMMALGLAAKFGKLSWKWAINIMVGIVCVFGSTAIVDLIIGWVS